MLSCDVEKLRRLEGAALTRTLDASVALCVEHTRALRLGVMNIAYKPLLKAVERDASQEGGTLLHVGEIPWATLVGVILDVVEDNIARCNLFSHENAVPAGVDPAEAAKQTKTARFLLSHLAALSNSCPEALEGTLSRMISLFSRVRGALLPFGGCSNSTGSLQENVSQNIAPLLDSVVFQLATSPFSNISGHSELLKNLCEVCLRDSRCEHRATMRRCDELPTKAGWSCHPQAWCLVSGPGPRCFDGRCKARRRQAGPDTTGLLLPCSRPTAQCRCTHFPMTSFRHFFALEASRKTCKVAS